MRSPRLLSGLLPAALAVAGALGALGTAGCEVFRARSEGEKLWGKHCARCHGVDAAGNTPRYMGNAWADLTDDSWRSGGDEYAIQGVIREGVFGEMPANDELSDAEVRAIVDWLYYLRGETR